MKIRLFNSETTAAGILCWSLTPICWYR